MDNITESELLKHQRSLYAFAYRLCKNESDAEDLVQETFIKAITNQHRFIENTNLKAWLFSILRNDFLSKLRRSKRMVEDVDGFFESTLVSPDNPLKTLEIRQLVAQIRYLPKEIRKVLISVAVFGGSYEETANNLGLSIGTIKSRVSRARDYLETGVFQTITEEEFETPVVVVEEPDNCKWHDTIRILYLKKALDVSEIATKTGLTKIEVMEVISTLKLKRKKVKINEPSATISE